MPHIHAGNDTPISVAHTEIILFKLKGIGADKVLKIVTFTHCLLQVEMERRFFSCAVKVVENTELFLPLQALRILEPSRAKWEIRSAPTRAK